MKINILWCAASRPIVNSQRRFAVYTEEHPWRLRVGRLYNEGGTNNTERSVAISRHNETSRGTWIFKCVTMRFSQRWGPSMYPGKWSRVFWQTDPRFEETYVAHLQGRRVFYPEDKPIAPTETPSTRLYSVTCHKSVILINTVMLRLTTGICSAK